MKRKTIFLNLNPLFLPSIERRFEMMALKGWMLDEINEYSMVFKYSEPLNLVFNILIQPGQISSQNENTPMNDVEKLCVEDGWNFRAKYRGFSVFSNADRNATPIHTDPSQRYQSIFTTTVFAGSIFGILFMILLVLISSFNPLETYLWFEPTVASFIIILYLFVAISIISVTPVLTWLWINRDKNKKPTFEFPYLYHAFQSRLLFALYLLPSVLILSYPFFMQTSNVANGIYIFGFIGVLIAFSFSKWDQFRKGKRTMPIELKVFACILLTLTGILSVGGNRFIQSFIFQPERYIKLSDFALESNNVNAYEKASVGLYGYEKANYSEGSEQGIITTQIMVFYSDSHKEKYWDTLRTDYKFENAIIKDQRFIGYFLKEYRGVLLQNEGEIILIISTFDLSQSDRLDVILNKLDITH